VIVLDSAWRDSNEGFETLQAKSIIPSFAVDGQMVAMYPDVAHLRGEIVIACHVDPGHRTAAYAEQVAPVVARYGGALRLKRRSEPWPPSGSTPPSVWVTLPHAVGHEGSDDQTHGEEL
jgi:hypothetical protein